MLAGLMQHACDELPGRLIVNSSVQLPQLGDTVVVKLSHGWYHGSLLERSTQVLVGADCNFVRCRATVLDPMYPAAEPQEPLGHYDCLEWAPAMWATTREITRLIRAGGCTQEMIQRAEKLSLEHIVGVAVRQQGHVYRLSWPARHHMILHMLNQTIGLDDHEQGFWTSGGRYVSREQAAELARAAGQTVSQRRELFSEDLW